MSAGNAVAPRVRAASERFAAAQKELYNALAEQCRLDLIEYIDGHNKGVDDEYSDEDERQERKIEGLTFESEYQYDDQGGYYLYDSVYPIVDDASVADDLYDFGDFFQGYGHEALCILCGEATDSFSGSIFIDKARERRF